MKIYGILLNILSMFWNMSPTGAIPNDNLVYLNLPNGQENLVNYDFLSNFRLSHPELTLINVRYLIPARLSRISFNVALCVQA